MVAVAAALRVCPNYALHAVADTLGLPYMERYHFEDPLHAQQRINDMLALYVRAHVPEPSAWPLADLVDVLLRDDVARVPVLRTLLVALVPVARHVWAGGGNDAPSTVLTLGTLARASLRGVRFAGVVRGCSDTGGLGGSAPQRGGAEEGVGQVGQVG